MSNKKPTAETGIARGGKSRLAGVIEGLLPEIRGLIEEARQRAVTAANLSMVTLYWNVGRVVSTEIQSKPGRAGYGEALLARLGERLNEEYGRGFSERNLRDMRRFFELFEIRQPLAGESSSRIVSAVEGAAGVAGIRQPVAAELPGPIQVDLARHFHLGWSHYRILMGVADGPQRRFYFERACAQRWSKTTWTAEI